MNICVAFTQNCRCVGARNLAREELAAVLV
jgi:hypothetical protein